LKNKSFNSKLLIAITEIVLLVVLLVLWFSSEAIRQSKSLWILFLFNFPSQFLISVVPYEPVFLYFSKFYHPVTVTAICVIGTLLTEFLNYFTLKFFVDLKKLNKLKYNGIVQKLIEFFNKAPFLALLIAGIIQTPYYPFRFLVVLAEYPIQKYLFAVFVSRVPRYLLLAWLANTIKIPDYILIIFFGLIVMVSIIPLTKNILARQKSLNVSIRKAPVL
jgi:membrane protein YqaA with SNARE-associated domain